MGGKPLPSTADFRGRRRVLMLYDHRWLYVKTIADYLIAFRRFSEHDICYATALGPCPFDLDCFDAVVIHYSVKVCYPGHLSPSFARALRKAKCFKALIIQDEYQGTNANHAAMRDLGIGLVFTNVSPEALEKVYPGAVAAGIEFVQVLTGYVPLDLATAVEPRPMRERSRLIGYRGRNIGYLFGHLGREKLLIGQRMRAICDARGLKTDIEWEEGPRIYGDDWLRFLAGSKATLGTETGSNVFDFDGSLAAAIQRTLRKNPAASYEEIHERFLRERDGTVVMNQISPKIFEAVACRTALVLFEGRYSGVVEPEKHYIPLRKDFSNVDEVLRRLHDDDYLEALTCRAFDDVIASERYSYQALVRSCDANLQKQWAMRGYPVPQPRPWLPLPPCDALPPFRASYVRRFRTSWLRRAWLALPLWLRATLKPLVSPHRWRRMQRPVLAPVRWLRRRFS